MGKIIIVLILYCIYNVIKIWKMFLLYLLKYVIDWYINGDLYLNNRWNVGSVIRFGYFVIIC